MDTSEYTPPRYPTNLLQKDWSKRKIVCFTENIEFLRKVHDLEVLSDDVWLVTCRKSGTTWMQELLWLVLNNFDFETAKKEHLEIRSPFLEFNFMINKNMETCFQPIEETKQPRLIKTHLSLPLLPHQLWHKKAKVNRFRQVCIRDSESKRLQTFQVVYLVRNPKDAMVSQYYHGRSVGYIKDKTLDEFIGEQIQMPPLDDPIQHFAEFYALSNEPWLFYTSFERMKLDLRQVITDVCRFLEKTIDENTMQKMLSHLSFEEMKENPKTNHIWEYEQIRAKNGVDSDKPEFSFTRRGAVNGYKDELSEQMVQKLDDWANENIKLYNLTLDDVLLLNGNKARE